MNRGASGRPVDPGFGGCRRRRRSTARPGPVLKPQGPAYDAARRMAPADRGRDARWFRGALKGKVMKPCIPGRKSRREAARHGRRRHKGRNRIENLLARPKDWRIAIPLRHLHRSHGSFLSLINEISQRWPASYRAPHRCEIAVLQHRRRDGPASRPARHRCMIDGRALARPHLPASRPARCRCKDRGRASAIPASSAGGSRAPVLRRLWRGPLCDLFRG